MGQSLASRILGISFVSFLITFCLFAYADPSPGPSAIPLVVVPALSGGDFLAQVFGTLKGIGGLSALLKISAVITLVIASLKVSFLNQLLWSKLGGFQVYIAPILGLLAGLATVVAGSAHFSWALILTYLSAGAGAVFLHEILDSVKTLPGLGSGYVAFIAWVETTLQGPASSAPPVSPPSTPSA